MAVRHRVRTVGALDGSLWLDATCLKVRQGGWVVPVAAIIAIAANTEGRREIIGLGSAPSEAETFWTEFLRARDLGAVRLVISDVHTRLTVTIARVFEREGVKQVIQWINLSRNGQWCSVHWMRNAPSHVLRGQNTAVAAAMAETGRPHGHQRA